MDCDFIIGPRFHNIRTSSDNNVQVVTEHRETRNIHSKDARQFFPSFANQIVAVGEALSDLRSFTARKLPRTHRLIIK